MKEKKNSVKIIDIVYGLGVLIVIYHLGLALFRGNVIPYPDAMLPSTYLEIVTFRLAFGAIPMTLASISFWRSNCLGQSRHGKRNFILAFLPAAICLLCMIFYVILLILAMTSFVFNYGMTVM